MAEPTVPGAAGAPDVILGVDSGGSGLRVALGRAGRPGPVRRLGTVDSREPIRTGPDGIDAAHLLAQLLPAAEGLLRRTGGGRCVAVCVGAAGMATLGDDLRAKLPAALARSLGADRLALVADAVTAYAGALGQRPGAVVAAGTGMIAMGTDLTAAGGWRRADGWGHLLGDCGSGAWIGRAGLEAAMRAYDGRAGGSAVLLSRAEAVFGPVSELPGMLYPRSDRPAVLASFAPEVARCAPEDKYAAAILDEAAHHMADAAAAVCPGTAPVVTGGARSAGDAARAEAVGATVACTGGLFRVGEALLEPLRTAFAVRLPGVRLVEAAGDPLDGALLIASALASDGLHLPTDDRLLQVVPARPT